MPLINDIYKNFFLKNKYNKAKYQHNKIINKKLIIKDLNNKNMILILIYKLQTLILVILLLKKI